MKLLLLLLTLSSIAMAEPTFPAGYQCKPVKKNAKPVCKVYTKPQYQPAKIVIVNNNTNNNGYPAKYLQAPVVTRVVVERMVRESAPKNSISVLLGRSVTGLSTTQINANTFQAK